jgi:hypothetical protein
LHDPWCRGGVEAETDELSAYDRMIESGGALMDDKHSRFIEHLQTLALMKNTSKTQFSLPVRIPEVVCPSLLVP